MSAVRARPRAGNPETVMRIPFGRCALGASLLVVLLSACASRPDAAAVSSMQPQDDPYVQTSWTLTRWVEPTGRARALPAGHPWQAITLSFTREQGQARVSGFAGCNRYMGNYVSANQRLVFTVPAATRMACIPPQRQRLEQDYLAALSRVNASALDDTGNPRELRLSTDRGEVLAFARQPDPVTGGAGVRRLVYVDSMRVPCESGAGRALCYRVRDSSQQPWRLWHGEIQGFSFQPGIAYRLRVVEVPALPPAADAGDVRWVLDAVIEQTVVAPPAAR